ncbi:MAG: hypothetical protein KF769_05440 [Parvibaculum sp.]|nr:hypothetical protein [Parvibaculum sp.]
MTDFFPTCQDITVTVAPGGEEVRAVDAEVVAIMAASDAFLLAFDDGGWQAVEAGLTYMGRRRPDGSRPRCRKLRFKNATGAPIVVVVQVSVGEIIDNRVVFGGVAIPVQPIDFNGPQPVAVTAGPWATNDGGSIPRVGGSEALLTTGNTDFVNAGTNVNGVILRRAVIGGSGGTDQVHILAGTRRVLSNYGAGAKYIGELFIPAGLRLRGEIPTSGRIDISFSIL